MLDPHRRDAVISAAIAQGKFSESRRSHWQALYDRDPAGTERTLAMLAPVPADAEPAASGFNSPHTAELFPDLARGQRYPARETALATAAPPAAARPVPAAGDASLTPEVVAAWSRQLFPEAAPVGIRPGRVTRAGD